MAEYIDREEMLKYIEEHNAESDWLVSRYNADWIYSFIDSRPTADVVATEELEKYKKRLLNARRVNKLLKAEIARLKK